MAARILSNWNESVSQFVKVYPHDYRNALQERERIKKASDEALEENSSVKNNLPKEEAKKAGNESSATVNDIEDLIAAFKNTIPKGVDGKIKGFMRYSRRKVRYRTAAERSKDFEEVFTESTEEEKKVQSARCMDCGVPFCQSHEGCPIDNLIPEFNALVYNGDWKQAYDVLKR